MKASYYLRAQNFAAPSVNDNNNNIKKYNWYGDENDDDSSRNGIACTNNIMFDSRVCRGNTYATPVFTEDQRRHQEVYNRTQQARRATMERRRMDREKRPITPPPVEGRVHVMVQTDGTLEDIFGSNNIIVVDYCSENEDEQLVGSLDGMIPEGDEISSRGESDESFDDVENMEPNRQEGESIDEQDLDLDEYKYKNNDQCVEGQEEWSENDENLTQNLARIIYDEAKNDAILRIEEGSLYQSDPER